MWSSCRALLARSWPPHVAVHGASAGVFAVALGAGHGATAAPGDFIHADGTRLVDGHGDALCRQGHQSRQLAGARRLHVQLQARARAERDRRGHRALIGPRGGGAVLDRIPRRLHRQRRYPFHQGGRLQHRARAAALAAVRRPRRRRGPDRFDGPGWTLLDRLVAVVPRAGLRVIIDLHAAPGGQTGVNHDDGAGLSAHILRAALPAADRRAMARARRALSRRTRGARLRPDERADLALQRRGVLSIRGSNRSTARSSPPSAASMSNIR